MPDSQLKKQRGGKREGAGRNRKGGYMAKFHANPDGSSVVRLPNRVLAYWEHQALIAGKSYEQWISEQETLSRIL